MPGDQPNIIWIFPDEWRHDAFGFAGNPVVRTPNIDALAARGAVFANAHCESPVCMSSRASLAFGLYPSQHGLHDNEHFGPSAGRMPAAGELPTFMDSLRKTGYRTAEIGKMHFFNRAHTPEELMAYGFDETAEEHDKYVLWRMDTPYTRYLMDHGLHEQWVAHTMGLMQDLRGGTGPKAKPEAVPAEHTLDAFIGAQAERFIRGYDRDDPFFLWVAPIGPHMPYDGPSPYADLYDPATIPLGPTGLDVCPENEWGRYLRQQVEHLRCGDWTEDDFRLIGKHYYALCTLIDDLVVGRIVQALAETGRDRDTWILLSSDHGELLGDHGFISKRVFYDASVRVPQVVSPPVGWEGTGGVRVDSLTQGFDTPSTFLDLAGGEWLDGRSSGRSLRRALTDPGTFEARDAVHSEIGGFNMVRTGRYKGIFHTASGSVQAVYDLGADPDERVDLLAAGTAGPALDALTAHADRFFTSVRG